MSEQKEGPVNNEVVHTLRPGIKNWVLDPTNSSIRHTSGFAVRFSFEPNGDMIGHVIEGYPDLEGADDGTRRFRVEWLKRMLAEAAACFEASLQSQLH